MHKNEVFLDTVIRIEDIYLQRLEDYVLLMKWSPFKEKVINIKCDVIVDAWLGQIVVTDGEVGIFLFTQTMPAVKLYHVQVFMSNVWLVLASFF